MPTKREMVDELQALANQHLGHRGLCFDTYMRLTKAELEQRLVYARQMVELDEQARQIEAQYDPTTWDVAHIFPARFEDNPKILEDIQKVRELLWASGDLWVKV